MVFPTSPNAATKENRIARAPSLFSLPRITARVHAAEGAHTRGGGGLRSFLLSLLSDPSGSSDSLHSSSGTQWLLSLFFPVIFQCLPTSSPTLATTLSCLVSFHRSQPRSRRVEGSALHAQTAATSVRPRTNLPAPLLLSHGPAFLLRRRRVEGDPDLTVFLRPSEKALKKPHTPKVQQHFRLALRSGEGGRGETEREKKDILDTKPLV